MADSWLKAMQAMPPELIWVFLLLSSYVAVLLMLRLFGVWGVTVFLCVSLIAANLQVLKAVQFAWFPDPIALGTVVFSTTFLCTDILSEYYGAKAARRSVILGFCSMILFTWMMLLALGFQPLPESIAQEGWQWGLENHLHMTAIFQPIPSILLAGIIAYLCSQILDIWVYQKIRSLSQNRFRWLRNNLSTSVSALIDNTIFSVLAWIVLTADPLPWAVVWKTYILGTYFLRILLALFDTPVLYLAGFCLPRSNTETERINGTAS